MPSSIDITGDPSSKKGLVVATDAFGIEAKVQFGADMLATHLNAVVLIPDLFLGQAASMDWIPPDTPEKEALVREWEQRFNSDTEIFPRLMDFFNGAKQKLTSVEGWGIYGLCFGGRVSSFQVCLALIDDWSLSKSKAVTEISMCKISQSG